MKCNCNQGKQHLEEQFLGSLHNAGNLSWDQLGCTDGYAVLEQANETKLHVFATKHMSRFIVDPHRNLLRHVKTKNF